MRLLILALLFVVGCSTRTPRVMSLSPWGERCYVDSKPACLVSDDDDSAECSVPALDAYVTGPMVNLDARGDLVFICSAYTGYRWQLSAVHPLAGYEGFGPKEIKID